MAACLILSDHHAMAMDCRNEAATSRLVGSMIIAGFFGTKPSDPGFQQILADLEGGLIGGIIILGRNVGARQDLEEMIKRISECKCATIPFIAIDDEGGSVERIGKNIGFDETPSAAAVAGGSIRSARNTYGLLARKLSSLHFNTNLAPVVDLNSNPSNPIIGQRQRSYGNDADTVVKYATAFIVEHRRKGILTVLKHFPGHGSSTTDSHAGIADVTSTWSPAELKPFKRLIAAGLADAIMVGHLANSNRWGNIATQNGAHAIDRLLRRELRYDGVIMTDDLAMKATLDAKQPSAAAVAAVKAGADLIIFTRLSDEDQTSDVGREINRALTAAACSQEIRANALQRSAARVRELKSRWTQHHRERHH